MEELRIYKNDYETIVIEWRWKEVGYIVVGKKYYTVNIHMTEYYTGKKTETN